jgi:hypothetical protein
LGNITATVKYKELADFCKAARAEKGSNFENVLANYPNISDNLHPYKTKFAKDYVKKFGPYVF